MGRNGIRFGFFSLSLLHFPFLLGCSFFPHDDMANYPTHHRPTCRRVALNCSSSLVVIGALSEWESHLPYRHSPPLTFWESSLLFFKPIHTCNRLNCSA
ncbi:hypothetical protein J3E72DRAFT_357400 [Bipolaris maydis]|uniref:uncharacterized protein n=1 Tax=Cochliobolus heterostrophus TaxID=5016 RepID=UPI0024D5AF3B|nr:hypothetical protein J3E73DRAFT_342869 [Bipolaris maydis]KAJ5064479.1 hypothetical protein J3E74DRAFT_312759 [Bipolaris maydis]KAJ6193502.1 hypothetical protein J3E72DRAFT_357400 [Bipolaris maydis]KAJ6205085.1 hypothetical protein PSV09DRAFT_2341365 [Bipolaris maydis]KAJ6268084.1 hypothetical protein PSV08DRAFT_324577 [Bipolaris maydis]